ncbi:hypothetical protein [Nocardia aurea]|uniref:hypothetical protein n=1 Tax=Nocardia aurea TaxID=2144174 RepID=UPI00130080DC|nr:hypothetical protein [Nocardia aurea]
MLARYAGIDVPIDNAERVFSARAEIDDDYGPSFTLNHPALHLRIELINPNRVAPCRFEP